MLERRTLDGRVVALVSPQLEAEGITVAFTERAGGVSEPPFDSLNLSLATGDRLDRVHVNRAALCTALAIRDFALGAQVHGATCAEVGPARGGAGFHDRSGAVANVDCLVSGEPDVALAVLVADCVPIALAAPEEGRVAVVHAGWRGIAAGIVGAAVSAFRDPGGLQAVIGPAVGLDHYEVGREVADAVSRAAGGHAALAGRGERTHLDLGATAAGILRGLGVDRIERSELCTACEPSRFYSHRRDGPRTGRQAVVAVRRTM